MFHHHSKAVIVIVVVLLKVKKIVKMKECHEQLCWLLWGLMMYSSDDSNNQGTRSPCSSSTSVLLADFEPSGMEPSSGVVGKAYNTLMFQSRVPVQLSFLFSF
jgi:hypothetical protein